MSSQYITHLYLFNALVENKYDDNSETDNNKDINKNYTTSKPLENSCKKNCNQKIY